MFYTFRPFPTKVVKFITEQVLAYIMILIIESNLIIGLAIKHSLSELDYEIVLTRNLSEGGSLTNVTPKYIVASDEVFDIKEQNAQVQEFFVDTQIPVVVLITNKTAYTQYSLNIIGLIHKPFNANEVYNCIKEYRNQKSINL